MKSHLVDVGVWLALTYDAHPHHQAAKRWYSELGNRTAFFCRITQLGLLRLLTHRAVMKSDTLTQRQAWKIYDTLRGETRTAFLSEAGSIGPELRRLTNRRTSSSKMWTDAYLAALANSAGLSVVTFDGGFSALKVDAEIISTRQA